MFRGRKPQKDFSRDFVATARKIQFMKALKMLGVPYEKNVVMNIGRNCGHNHFYQTFRLAKCIFFESFGGRSKYEIL